MQDFFCWKPKRLVIWQGVLKFSRTLPCGLAKRGAVDLFRGLATKTVIGVACFFVAAHLIVALILIGAIYIVQVFLLSVGDPKLFDRIPVRYLFDAMDLFILLEFVVFGTIDACYEFSEDMRNRRSGRRPA